ncbi:TPA: hypothetical protein SMG11_005118 [Serratia marcescens]|uniref:hypothetical protein n=1 Tax=Serratia TaxID=613 RepID=UPI00143C5616|nr:MULTISPECIES: hypothetical protein [Serratia]EIJ9186557.1 hypothetical protein [Serratia marcescens]EIJ9190583.1 hypothetical protein [Serratia marcescens]EIY4261897.1 hypothetical protein [Serratia marcescens]MBH1896951.1 hypothetical protein [Serratia marcescens]MBH2520952.1 hypothetical protein [Serratia marcescens]
MIHLIFPRFSGQNGKKSALINQGGSSILRALAAEATYFSPLGQDGKIGVGDNVTL